MMRLVRVLCLLACLLCVCASISLADQVFYFPEFSMLVSIPDSWDVLTRNMDPDAAVLMKYGQTSENVTSLLTQKNSYLNAYPESMDRAINITMTPIEIQDYSLLDDETLEDSLARLRKSVEERGLACMDLRTEKIGDITYMIMEREETDQRYALQCLTAHNYCLINITLVSYGAPVSDEDRDMMMHLIQTAQYDVESEGQTLQQGTMYSDRYDSCMFSLPAGWSQTRSTDDSQSMDVRFGRDDGSADTIMFGVTDLYEEFELSEDENPRSLVGDDLLTEEDLASMGFDPTTVTTVSYNGIRYYQSEMQFAIGDERYCMYLLLACRNGYLYMFQFAALNETAPDLIQCVMNTVRYR